MLILKLSNNVLKFNCKTIRDENRKLGIRTSVATAFSVGLVNSYSLGSNFDAMYLISMFIIQRKDQPLLDDEDCGSMRVKLSPGMGKGCVITVDTNSMTEAIETR